MNKKQVRLGAKILIYTAIIYFGISFIVGFIGGLLGSNTIMSLGILFGIALWTPALIIGAIGLIVLTVGLCQKEVNKNE